MQNIQIWNKNQFDLPSKIHYSRSLHTNRLEWVLPYFLLHYHQQFCCILLCSIWNMILGMHLKHIHNEELPLLLKKCLVPQVWRQQLGHPLPSWTHPHPQQTSWQSWPLLYSPSPSWQHRHIRYHLLTAIQGVSVLSWQYWQLLTLYTPIICIDYIKTTFRKVLGNYWMGQFTEYLTFY